MEVWLGLLIFGAFCVGVVLFIVRLILENRVLNWRLQHEYKMPTGSFRVKVSAKEWDEQVRRGAFALGMKDSPGPDGKVVFTIIVERET